MTPQIVRHPALLVVGMAGRFRAGGDPGIPALWQRFAGGPMATVPHRRGTHTFGLWLDPDPPEAAAPEFTYVAGVEVERTNGLPAGLTAHPVPANRYAVFTHTGHIRTLPDTIKRVFAEWMPASGLVRTSAPAFERYDERWNPETGEGPVDLYIPIA